MPDDRERTQSGEDAWEEARLVDPEPVVLEGDDDLPRQPSPPLDPFTPEPGPRPGEERAFRVLRWAWVPILIVVAIVLIGLLR